jgi:hypothetical protein
MSGPPANPGGLDQEEMVSRAALERAITRWNMGDLDGYMELYDSTIALHGYSPEPMDKTAAAAFYRGMFESIDDLRLDVEDGRHTGPLFGVPGTGRSISQSVMTTLRFVDGRCVERWSVADTLAVLVQIGAVSPPT